MAFDRRNPPVVHKRLPPLNWVTPQSSGNVSRVAPRTRPERKQRIRDARVSRTGADEYIPLVYGTEHVSAYTPIIDVHNGRLVVLCIWCVGEIDEISQIYFNDAPISGGVVVTNYVGTTGQGVDPTLAEAISGWTSTLVYTDDTGNATGIAYSVLQIPVGACDPMPDISATIKGRLCYEFDGGLKSHTENAAAVLGDICSDPLVGKGLNLDDASWLALHAKCAEEVSGFPRRLCSITLDSPEEVETWIETLRVYANALLNLEGDVVYATYFWPEDVAAEVDWTLSQDDMVKGSFRERYKQQGTPSTVYEVGYTNRLTTPPTPNRVSYVDSSVTSLDKSYRVETVSMPGCPTRSQALRESEERYNATWRAPWVYSWRTGPQGFKYAVGDIVDLSHPMLEGRSPSEVYGRIISISASGPFWDIEAEDVVDGMHSSQHELDTVGPGGSSTEYVYPPGSGPGVDNNVAETTSNAIQNINLLENYADDSVVPPRSTVRATWDAPAGSLLAHYEVKYLYNGQESATEIAPVQQWTTPQLVTPGTITVYVRAVAIGGGATSPWGEATLYITGRTSSSSATGSLSCSGGTDCFSGGARPFNILVSFTPSAANSVVATEVWQADTNNRSAASLSAVVAKPSNSWIQDNLTADTTRYFWTRSVDSAGSPGPWNATAGTPGTSSCSATKVMDYIDGEISKTNLHLALQGEINDKLSTSSSAWTSMTTQVSGHEAQWVLKLQSGVGAEKVIAGIGLAADATTDWRSQMLVRVDRFAICGTTGTSSGWDYPFIVQDGAVYMRKALIGVAYIETANIANLNVTNSKVGDKAITNGLVASGGYRTVSSSGYTTITNEPWADCSQAYALACIGATTLTVQSVDDWFFAEGRARLTVNGSQVKSVVSCPAGYTWTTTTIPLVWNQTGTFGSSTFGMQGGIRSVSGFTSSPRCLQAHMSVFILKK